MMRKKIFIIPCIIILAVVIVVVVAMASPTANSFLKYYVLGKKEINKIYIAKVDGKETYLAKPSGDISEKSINWMADRMSYINEEYLKDSKVYYSIIPDKGYYLSKESDYKYLDFMKLEDELNSKVNSFSKYISIKDELSLSDFYYTDSHWRQEKLLGVTSELLRQMDANTKDLSEKSLEEKVFLEEYTGVYYDRINLSVNKDVLKYLTGDYIDNLKVTNYATGEPVEAYVYNFDVIPKENYYEFFMMGNQSLITIENPSSNTDKELIVFRDSFGSCIAPLLAEGYSKLTLVDIRYLSPSRLGEFIDFHGQDVLFLYSAAVINNSVGQLKK